jgi:hypothetical protein
MLALLDKNGGRGDQLRLPKLLAPFVAVCGKEPANDLRPQKMDLVN